MTMILDGTITFSDTTVQNSSSNTYALGVGQTWQNVSGSRTSGTTYYNTTGRPITVSAGSTTSASTGSSTSASVNGVVISSQNVSQVNCGVGVTFVVPSMGSYSVAATYPWSHFAELR